VSSAVQARHVTKAEQYVAHVRYKQIFDSTLDEVQTKNSVLICSF
jgi:hypothetical protein